MALNFGVKPQKPAVAGPAPSMEELFDAYVGVESVVRATDVFLQKGQQIEDAFENLCIVGSALKKHASAEGLAVVKDIVRDELGVEVSVEAFKEKAKAALEAIRAFFAKIGVWIKEFFAKILNFVLRADKRLDKAIAYIKTLPDDVELKWSYKGVGITRTESFYSSGPSTEKTWLGYTHECENVIDAVMSRNDPKDLESDEIAFLNEEATRVHEVKGKDWTLKVLECTKKLIAKIPHLKETINKEYSNAKSAVANPGENADIATLKNKQKRMRIAVGIVNKYCSVYSRAIASIITHVPMKATKEK